MAEELTERESNTVRRKACGGYLIDEWWKLVVVVLVDQNDLHATVLEVLGEAKSSQASSYDNHPLLGCTFYVDTHVISFLL
jgi:hypothetical protein